MTKVITVEVCEEKPSEELVPIWVSSFGDSADETKAAIETIKDCARAFTVRYENTVISQAIAFSMHVGGIDGMYLYAVATDEKYRHQGYMTRTIGYAENIARDEGLGFLCLIPENEKLSDMYGKLGFCGKARIFSSPCVKNAEDIYAHIDKTAELKKTDAMSAYEASERYTDLETFRYALSTYPDSELYITDGGYVCMTPDCGVLAATKRLVQKMYLTDGKSYLLYKKLYDFDGSILDFAEPLPR